MVDYYSKAHKARYLSEPCILLTLTKNNAI